MGAPSTSMVPSGGPDDPDDALQGGRLAGAVAPEERNHLAGRRLEGDVREDVGPPVVAVQALYAEPHFLSLSGVHVAPSDLGPEESPIFALPRHPGAQARKIR